MGSYDRKSSLHRRMNHAVKRIRAGIQRWYTFGSPAIHFDVKGTIIGGKGMFETVAIGDTYRI